MQAAKAADIASVQRNVVVRTNSGRSTEDEPFAANVVYHGLLAGLINLAPQPAHVNVDEVAARYEFVVPDFFEQHGTGEQLVLAAHHVLEQTKFTRQQLHAPFTALGGACEKIEFERADAQDGVLVFRGPAQQRFDAGDKLDDRERFGEIIVAARAQPAHPIVDRSERAQDQDRGANAVLPAGLDDGAGV